MNVVFPLKNPTVTKSHNINEQFLKRDSSHYHDPVILN